MASEWKPTSLKEHINIKHGFAFKGEYFVSNPSFDCLVTPGNFSIGGGFKEDKFKYYKGPIPEDYILGENDLIVTMTDLSKEADTLGYSALVPALEDKRLLHNQRVGLVEFKDEELARNYLYFLLRSQEYRHHVISSATGTTVKHTSPKKILSFDFLKPPKVEQEKIGDYLFTLERKIELNKKINQTLEQMAQAIFKSWFVDFDPVFDNLLDKHDNNLEKAKAYLKSKGAEDLCPKLTKRYEQRQQIKDQKPLPQDIRNLFPSDFHHDQNLGWIPEGWEATTVNYLCEKIQNGGTPKRDNDEYWSLGDIPWLTSGEVRSNWIVSTEQYITQAGYDNSSTKLLKEGSVVVAMYGATAGEVGYTFIPLTTNQAICGLTPKDNYQLYLYFDLKRQVSSLSNQARGSAQQNISKGIVERTKTLHINEKLLIKFNSIILPYFKNIEYGITQVKSLASLRDALLPRLINGTLKLGE